MAVEFLWGYVPAEPVPVIGRPRRDRRKINARRKAARLNRR